MIEMKFTRKGMPVISDETVEKLYMNGKSWVEQLERVRNTISDEDPNLLEYINQQLEEYTPDLRDILAQELMGFYRVLEMQSEENKSNNS